MNSKLNSIVITYFIAFAIIAGIPTVFENVLHKEKRQQSKDRINHHHHHQH
jgi:hypothetical protein